MSTSSMDWANLDSANERVVGATEQAGEPPGEAPQPGSAADEPGQATPGRGRHRRTSRTAAAVITAAIACAVAVPVSASAAQGPGRRGHILEDRQVGPRRRPRVQCDHGGQ